MVLLAKVRNIPHIRDNSLGKIETFFLIFAHSVRRTRHLDAKKKSPTMLLIELLRAEGEGFFHHLAESEGFSLVFPIFPIFHRSSSFTNVSKNHRVGSIF